MEEIRNEATVRPKSRQSLAHVPSKANVTTDIAALKRIEEAKEKSKRSRGKSLGPGGLEALTETNANALKVGFAPSLKRTRITDQDRYHRSFNQDQSSSPAYL